MIFRKYKFKHHFQIIYFRETVKIQLEKHKKNPRTQSFAIFFLFLVFFVLYAEKSKLIERKTNFQKKYPLKSLSLFLFHVFDFRNMLEILQSNNKIFGKKITCPIYTSRRKKTVRTLIISIFFFNFTIFLLNQIIDRSSWLFATKKSSRKDSFPEEFFFL